MVVNSTSSSQPEKAPTTAPDTALANLLENMRSVQLSTTGADGAPHCGYTPYLHRDGHFYIFVSRLAAHTRDMLLGEENAAAVTVAMMIIADEISAKQIFARPRVSYQCVATSIARDALDYESILDEYQERHGKMAGLLRQLPDFVLFRLQPTSGQFVMGFGQAYKLAGDDLSDFELARIG